MIKEFQIFDNKKYKRGLNKIDPYNEENWGNEEQLPGSMKGVKCMIRGCKNLARHKVGEENPWNRFNEEDKRLEWNQKHELTTYLCKEHFDWLMNREEVY